jgi:hypothetical protein
MDALRYPRCEYKSRTKQGNFSKTKLREETAIEEAKKIKIFSYLDSL